jgi:hypothetical protein
VAEDSIVSTTGRDSDDDIGADGTAAAQPEISVTTESMHKSSALLRPIAGNMALLVEDVRAVLPRPGSRSSVLKLITTRNPTLAALPYLSLDVEVQAMTR